VGGGISGFPAAKASGSGIWFGTEVKPSASIIVGKINNETNEALLEYENLLRSQKEPSGMGNTAAAVTSSENSTSGIISYNSLQEKFGETYESIHKQNHESNR